MYREVTMIEFREVFWLWQEQVPKKRIAARLRGEARAQAW